MIPYKDDNPTYSYPIVTVALIFLNVAVFVWEGLSPLSDLALVSRYGAIPYSLTTFQTIQPISPITSIFTSMFMHGGLLHLLGNMLYLWIFGDNVEDAMGKVRFLLFYLLSGVVAVYGHALSDAESLVPLVGASGAISGVLGAYLMLFPKAGVKTLVFFGLFWILRIPAFIVIGMWAVVQFLSGAVSAAESQQGGVAWFAHIGGFLFGLATVRLWVPRK
ncbi:MAG TPA: rhomboid family intramembrane serine protease [Dissulfurispiraceae bacterium]|nr:rhomboid family intramembrane serine protease [Dissulfurispiraceae bacterium]